MVTRISIKAESLFKDFEKTPPNLASLLGHRLTEQQRLEDTAGAHLVLSLQLCSGVMSNADKGLLYSLNSGYG